MSLENIIVSVCCITYNHREFIEQALDSFLSQKTSFRYEIIVHDDCSTDGTTEVLKLYENKYPDIIHVLYETTNQYSQNKKKSMLMDYTIPHAKGKYIAICEGDDYWCDIHKLQKQYEILENNDDISCSFHDAKVCNVDGKIISNSALKYRRVYDKRASRRYSCDEIIEIDFYPTASLFFRKDVLKNFPEYFHNGVCGDLPLRITLGHYGDSYCFNYPMSVYRTGNSNSASGKIISNGNKIAKTLDVHCWILKEFDIYTNNIHHNAVENEIRIKQFEKYVALKDFKTVTSKPYDVIYKNLSIKEQLKIRLKCQAPRLYSFCKKMYYFLKIGENIYE